QYVFRDSRLGDFCRPTVWRSYSDRQIFLISQLSKPLGFGSAVIAASNVPDIDFFCNRGGKDVMPLYRDAPAREPNITHGLLELLEQTYGSAVTPEDLIGYIAGVLGHPGY